MRVTDLLFGPQILGAPLCLFGLVMYRFPPKRINKWYGYRTESSMKNQETWNEANRYFARLMAKMGLIIVVVGLALTAVLDYWISDGRTRAGLLLGMHTLSIIPLVIVMAKTESHLEKTFKKDEIH